ncbi:MAG: tetraacyldisaccharide 4'-kinase [Filomicrobium sp.]
MLRPVSRVYAWAVQRRFAKSDPHMSSLPVICVGNFTAGGTGKTPLSLLISKTLVAQGARPVFLTRGYSGNTNGPHWVNLETDNSKGVGDEPLLLAQTAPTLVARNRAEGARAIERTLSASHIIMDDGLQNPKLAKSLTIAVVDGIRGLGNGEVIPAGPLRAPLEFQFELADAIVVNGPADNPTLRWLRQVFHGPVLAASVKPEEQSAAAISGRRLVAYAGIGNPQRFTDLITGLGGELVEQVFFKDHHGFTEEDAAFLLARAAETRATLVTTAKDYARIAGAAGEIGALARHSLVLEISLDMDARDLARLETLISEVKPAAWTVSG